MIPQPLLMYDWLKKFEKEYFKLKLAKTKQVALSFHNFSFSASKLSFARCLVVLSFPQIQEIL